MWAFVISVYALSLFPALVALAWKEPRLAALLWAGTVWATVVVVPALTYCTGTSTHFGAAYFSNAIAVAGWPVFALLPADGEQATRHRWIVVGAALLSALAMGALSFYMSFCRANFIL